MKIVNVITVIAAHFVLTVCITGGLMYGEYRLLRAYPTLDDWLWESFGWGGIFAFMVVYFAIGVIVSRNFVTRILIPWLDAK